MVPNSRKTCLGMEYFCNISDELWQSPDASLIELATRELESLGLAKASRVLDGVVIRQPKAYPVYDSEYKKNLKVIEEYLATFENLQTTGRNGMHRYNNQDHSMLTGLLAAKNLLGEKHNLWEVNTERSYYEEFTKKDYSQESSKNVEYTDTVNNK
jgi:protoporphyrinogen oxidase